MADADVDATASAHALELRRVVKSFGPVVALRSGSLTLDRGSIHALIGENGAGKSTLVKVIAGLYRRDSGEFLLDGEPVDFHSTAQSKAAGIAVIYQEPTLFPDLSVTENIFMGRQPTNRFGRIDRRAMRDEATQIFTRLGVALDPERITEGLSIADQQIIEIAKAISLDARVLIMDEPTAALSGVEVERLFAVARSLRDEGRALLFISHRFDEVFALCDTVTVMRDGSYVDTTADRRDERRRARPPDGRPRCDRSLPEAARARSAMSSSRSTGSPGSACSATSRSRSARARSSGLRASSAPGAARSRGRSSASTPTRAAASACTASRCPKGIPRAATARGLALVPEDRRKQGLVLDESVTRNVTLAIRTKLAKWGLLWGGAENRAAQEWASRLEVKTAALDAETGTLSGGNQQKVVLGKWLATEPTVLIVDEPTRGIDVGTKAEVHRLLSELAQQGLAILMISSELPEVLGMADRVLVMREGRLTGEFPRQEATPEAVMFAATADAEVAQ